MKKKLVLTLVCATLMLFSVPVFAEEIIVNSDVEVVDVTPDSVTGEDIIVDAGTVETVVGDGSVIVNDALGEVIVDGESEINAPEARGTYTLTSNETWSSSEFGAKEASYKYVKLAGYTLTLDCSLSGTDVKFETCDNGKLIINGSAVFSDGLDFNKGTVEVGGNLTLTGGNLYAAGASRLTVASNFSMSGTANYNLWYDNNNITVKGNLIYDTTQASNHNSGLFTVYGNIEQKDGTGYYQTGTFTFTDGKNHQLSMQSNSNIEGLNPGDGAITVNGYFNCANLNADFAPAVPSGTLRINRSIKLHGHKLTAPGNLNTTGEIAVGDNGKLEVNGNFTSSNGFDFNRGSANIKGDMNITGGSLYAAGASRLTVDGNFIMSGTSSINTWYDNNTVIVKGNLIYDSTQATNHNSAFYTVYGNIEQKDGAGYYQAGTFTFTDGKNHQLSLLANSNIDGMNGGDGVVTVDGYFNCANLNADFAPVVPSGTLRINRNIKLQGHKLTVPHNLNTTGEITTGDNGVLEVNGNFTSSNGLVINKGAVNVKGNFNITAGDLYAAGASRLNVDGDLTMSGTSSVNIWYDNNNVTVKGNLVYDSSKATNHNSGFYTVYGNVEQKNGSAYYQVGTIIFSDGAKHKISMQSNHNIDGVSQGNGEVTVEGVCNIRNLNSDFTPVVPSGTFRNDVDMRLNGHTFTVPNNFTAYGNVVVGEKGQLIVKGNLETNKGIAFDKAKVSVVGDYTNKKGSIEPGSNSSLNVTGNFNITGGNLWYGANSSEIIVGKDFSYTSADETTTNNSVWVINGDLGQSGDAAKINFNMVTMATKGSTIELPNGRIGTLKLVASKEQYTIMPDPCYDKLILPNVFTDVVSGAWYVKAVEYAVENNIMSGIGNNKFGPNDKCTREMMVQILYSANGSPAVSGSNPFSDIPAGKWYTTAVIWAVQANVTSGINATTFGRGQNVTRQQMAGFLYSFARFKGYDITARANVNGFVDAGQISNWALESIRWANANGIINGKGGGRLDPKGTTTRAEVAQMIMGFQNKFGK